MTLASTPPAAGKLLAILTVAFYVLFTLLPDSNSLMVAWPWVFLWQVGWLCPVLWLLGLLWQQKAIWLGNRLDWIMGIGVIGVILSTSFALYPNQARWYGWIAIAWMATVYAIRQWVDHPDARSRLLTRQGYLAYAFIIVSLGLWSTQTLFPEMGLLSRLREQFGVTLSLDWSNIFLRNWAPVGHQNFVAGYLVLNLPLLVMFGWQQTHWQRWAWWIGVGLGILDLYTTSSRAGWLGLVVLGIALIITLFRHAQIARRWVAIGSVGGAIALVSLVLSNNRLQMLFSGKGGGETAFRLITNTAGWQMGASRWFTGQGLGSVPLVYQQFRPSWAGREAELVYQLHSTPAHLWSEMGLWAIALGISAIVWTVWAMVKQRGNAGYLWAGLVAYGVVALTDYQLDNVCISGTLAIFMAVLAAEIASSEREESRWTLPAPALRYIPTTATALLFVVLLFIFPFHRAWMISSQGFLAIDKPSDQITSEDVNMFRQRLEQASQTASWEPYYSGMLGWQLADFAVKTNDPQRQPQLLSDGVTWLDKAAKTAPQQEFAHSTLGWLFLNQSNPQAADSAFTKAAQLVPAKRGVFYGLALSRLGQANPDSAIAALTLEAVRDPAFSLSPLWRDEPLNDLSDRVFTQVDSRWSILLDQAKTPELKTIAQQCRGLLRWWRGDLAGARSDWDIAGTPLQKAIVNLSDGKSVESLGESSAALTVAAWQTPSDRPTLLQKAWVTAMKSAPPEGIIQQLVESMNQSANFDEWIQQKAPTRQYRRERTGFGVLSRHIDGPVPEDFLVVSENIPLAQLLNDLIPQVDYLPELDQALESDRAALTQSNSPK